MAYSNFVPFSFICISLFLVGFCSAEDPFANFEFEVSYITASPLGVPQQVRALDLSGILFYLFIVVLWYNVAYAVCLCLILLFFEEFNEW